MSESFAMNHDDDSSLDDEHELDAPEGDGDDSGSPAEPTPVEPPAAKESKPRSKAPVAPIPQPEEPEPESVKDWYILKVQSNRETSIADALRRRVKILGLEHYVDEIVVPVEKVTEFTKTGTKRTVNRKLYPGYIVVHMAINDDTWFLVRETPGIGDFTGAAGKPIPMLAHEVARIIRLPEEPAGEQPKFKFNFKVGGRVKIIEGTFENFEGEVEGIDEANGRVTVMINIFNRSPPVELEHWQAEAI